MSWVMNGIASGSTEYGRIGNRRWKLCQELKSLQHDLPYVEHESTYGYGDLNEILDRINQVEAAIAECDEKLAELDRQGRGPR